MISSFNYPTFSSVDVNEGGNQFDIVNPQNGCDQDMYPNQFVITNGVNNNIGNVNFNPYFFQEQIPQLLRSDQQIQGNPIFIIPERNGNMQRFISSNSHMGQQYFPISTFSTPVQRKFTLNSIASSIQDEVYPDQIYQQQSTYRNFQEPQQDLQSVQIQQPEDVHSSFKSNSLQPLSIYHPLTNFQQTQNLIPPSVYATENSITNTQQSESRYLADVEHITIPRLENEKIQDDHLCGGGGAEECDLTDSTIFTDDEQKDLYINGYIQLTTSEIEKEIEMVDFNYKLKLKLHSNGPAVGPKIKNKNGKQFRRSRFNKILTPCPIKSCPYQGMFKTCDYLKRHIREQHGKNARLYYCHGNGVEDKWGCGKGFKRLYQLHNHWKGPRSLKKCNVPKNILDGLE